MMEIFLMNVVFWTLWIQLSMVPERIMQYIIDNYPIRLYNAVIVYKQV